MATPAQIEANRLNAKKSTGPKTFKGKARCKMNALKHGFTTAQAVMDPLEEDLFPQFAQSITNRLRPQDELELALVDHIIQAAWRLRRLPRIETDYLRALQYTPGKSLGESLFDTDQQRKLFSLSNHETRIEKSMYRAIEQLATIRKIAPILSPEEKAQPVAFITHHHNLVEEIEQSYGWLEEEEGTIDRLLEQRKKLDKLRNQVVQALLSYNRQVRELERLQSLPTHPQRKQDCKAQEQRIWYALQELRTLQNSIAAFRNRPASPEANENQIASELSELVDVIQDQLENAKDVENKISANEADLESEEPISDPIETQSKANLPELKPNSDLDRTGSPAPSANRLDAPPDLDCAGSTALSPRRLDAASALRKVEGSDKIENRKSQIENLGDLSFQQHRALSRLRVYQRRMHKARQLSRSPEQAKEFHFCTHWMGRVMSEEGQHLRQLPQHILDYDPASDPESTAP